MHFVLTALVLITKWNEGFAVPDFYWKDYVDGRIPCDAFEAAPGRYIGLSILFGYNFPSTIYPEDKIAVTEFNGKQISKEYVRIFCTTDKSKFYWDFVDFDKPHDDQLEDVVKGGYETSIQPMVDLYIGKKIHEEEWKISKVLSYDHGDRSGLWLWDKEKTSQNFRQFYILKYNSTASCNEHCHTRA